MSATRDRAWLLAHLPHQGAMNLLEDVTGWDESTLHARAVSHRDAANPLRRNGLLPITAAVEYGAQAAAAHGVLIGSAGAGVLASMRGVRFHAARLDDVGGDLDVHASQVGASDAGVLYDFRVTCAGRLLAQGRVSVAFAR